MVVRTFALIALAVPIAANALTLNVSLATNKPSPQPVGTSISISATVLGDPDATPSYEYSFSIGLVGRPADVRRGFGHSSSWTWTPNAFEGKFAIFATVKNVHSGNSGMATISSFTLTSRLTSGNGVASTTSNPLVAFFSAPACLIPNAMRVRSTPASTVPAGGIAASSVTRTVPCRADSTSSTPDLTSMNFYVAGLYPSTAYLLRWEVITPGGTLLRTGPADVPFTAGAIAGGVFLPTFSRVGVSSGVNPIVLNSPVTIPVNGHVFASSATDVAGNVLWYSTNVPPVRLEFGGSYWGFISGADNYVQGIREVDLAGNAIAETTVGAVNEQLIALGKPTITAFHHEVRRIYTPNALPPNGNIVALGSVDRSSMTAQGGTPAVPVDIIGDMVLVLDHNFNVLWTWNAFDFLDINQRAILDEKCTQPAGGGCEPFNTAFSVANDWLHTNSVQYTAYDGNMVLSMRHQDAVLKIAYANGAGDGHIIWKLGHGPIQGPGGAPLPTIALFKNGTVGAYDLDYPWFSHQHDPEFELGGAVIGGSRILTIFDDGNARQPSAGSAHNSRCQLLAINESALVANLNRNVDVGTYSFALGSAQLLPNGNLVCDSGIIGGFAAASTNPMTETTEADGSANVIHTLIAGEDSYRTFRLQDLYTPDNP